MAIDLNAGLAARREALKESPTVIWGDPPQTFVLPVEMPFAVVEHLGALARADASDNAAQADALLDVMRDLLGDQYEAFMSHRPSMKVLEQLLDEAATEYGLDPGKSSASMPSSASTTKTSRPRSPRPTK